MYMCIARLTVANVKKDALNVQALDHVGYPTSSWEKLEAWPTIM